jgi:hypothetical protein
VCRNPHFVELIQTQPQDLARRGIQFVCPKPTDDKIKQRAIADYSVKGLSDKGSIALRQIGLFKGSVKDPVGKFPAGLPALQRFQTTDTRITGCHRQREQMFRPSSWPEC